MFLKGVVFPWLLFRALREAGVRREVEPVVGYSTSLLIGIAALGVALWLGVAAAAAARARRTHVVPLALFTILVGLFLIVSRKTGAHQVLGYLVLENGIFAFGVGLRCASRPARRDGRPARYLRGRLRHGHHDLPHQPRVRPHRHRPALDAEGLARDDRWRSMLLPALAGLAGVRSCAPNAARRVLLVAAALAHAGLTAVAWLRRPRDAPRRLAAAGRTGLLFLSHHQRPVPRGVALRRRLPAPRGGHDEEQRGGRAVLFATRRRRCSRRACCSSCPR